MIKKCAGCGVILQSDDKNKVGFVPEKKYIDANYCMRCFQMTHYGNNSNFITPYNNNELIDKINEYNKFTIFLIDFLQITNEVINLFKHINNDKVLVINKCEVLPKFLNRDRLINSIKSDFNIDSILLKGSNGSKEYEKIYDYLIKNNIKECLFAGVSNVGKSTLINDLMRLTKSDNLKLTVNKKENTTLDFVKLDMKDFVIIDTPGFILNNTLDIEKSKKIKSFIFQMKKDETLNIWDNFYINFDRDTNINYFTNYLYEKKIKKNYSKKLNYVTEIKIPKNYDLVIRGLGFITFKSDTIIKTNIDEKYLIVKKSIFWR